MEPPIQYEPPRPFEKLDVSAMYSLPVEVVYCTRCVISNQRPRIEFDEEGVCNACRYWERKETSIDWVARERKLRELCDRHRRSDGSHDVIVPSSGGKDSIFVAHQLKYEYGMNPLTVTWAPNVYTQVGWDNFQRLIRSGLDNVLATANGISIRRLTRICTIEMGDPFQPFIYGMVSFPLQVAVTRGIPLIMDGENGEAEYGGDPSSEDRPGFGVDDANEYWNSGIPLEHWLERGFTRTDLAMFMPPSLEDMRREKIERHFFSYYKNWRPQSHYYYAVEKVGFKANPEGRSEGTYSKYASLDDKIDAFHYYLGLLKFGLGRATSDAAHEIREGLITREEGVALVRRYDAEFPKKELQTFLDYCGFDEEVFWEVMERWRNPKHWKQTNGVWDLRHQVS